MTILSVIAQHCSIHALNVPTSVMGSMDTTVKQLVAIANQLVAEMIDESKFQAITREATFTFIASENQGSITDLTDPGFMWAYPKTFYDRTLRRPLYGPLTEEEWQQIKALPNPGPFYKFRIRGGELLINPVPSAPFSDIAFEYASSYGVKANDGTLKASFTEDTDSLVLPERILLRGLAFRWKQTKGLPYQSDETSYYDQLGRYIARNKVPREYNLAEGVLPDLSPGVFVPSGNWPV